MRRSSALRLTVPIAAVLAVGAVAVTGAATRPAASAPTTHKGYLGFEQAPDQAFLDERVGPGTPAISADAFQVIGQEKQRIDAMSASSDPADANSDWSFNGPTNIDNPHPPASDGGGRVPDLAVDPRPGDGGTVYIATAGGGVWKTTDGGKTITQSWPNSLPQAIGAIAVAPDGTVYAGTGETNPGGGSITLYGDGVYRSTDGGTTWTNIGLDSSWTIGRIMVNPTNSNEVWVAASGNLFIGGDASSSPAQQRGLYVTNTAEAATPAWTESIGPDTDTSGTLTTSTGAVDIAISQQNPNVVYTAMWDHTRSNNTWAYTGPGSSVWKSTDGGTTWTDLTSAANTVTDGLLADHNTDVGRIGIAVAPSNDNYVYVNYANETEGAQVAFFTSTNGGTSFTEDAQTSADFASNQTAAAYVYGWWFAKTFVDPTNPSHVFVTGLCLWQSTDAGSSATSDCNVHSDQHAMAWDQDTLKTSAVQVYAGDDGGFYTSTQNGAAGSFSPAANQPWPQFDGLDVSETDPTHIVGGLQDNGTQRSWDSNGNAVASNAWEQINGGDGQQAVIDPTNANIVYSCSQYGVCSVSNDGGNTQTEFDTTPLSLNQTCTTCTESTRNAYFTPIVIDPANSSIVYYGGDEINESTNNGSTWNLISSNLGGPNTGSNTDPLYAGHFGAATTMAVSQSNDNTVWIGTDSGCLWKTTDALTDNATVSWTNVSGACGPSATPPSPTPETTALPTQFVSKILIDPSNANNVFVAFSGYRSGDDSAYVERTNDGGATWTNLSGNLPEATVNSLALVAGRLYAATDTGVYVSDPGSNPLSDTSMTWDQFGANLPATSATALRFIPANGTLYVSTFGRGVWSQVIVPPVQTPESPAAFALPGLGLVVGGGLVLYRRKRSRRVALS